MMGKVPCERAAAPCLGHSPLHTGGPVPNLIGSSGSAMVCIYAAEFEALKPHSSDFGWGQRWCSTHIGGVSAKKQSSTFYLLYFFWQC